MNFFSEQGSAVATLVAAAMETTGVRLQTEMLQWVNGDAQSLAALLFLIAITAGVITFAAGGNYLWARYLLVAPPLFFFLTRVTVSYDSSQWQFGAEAFPNQRIEEVRRNAPEPESGEIRVSLFFQFWNIFMSTLTQDLIKLLNLTEDGSHQDFIKKVERYMTLWNEPQITDPNLLMFIKAALTPNCAEYYMKLKAVSDLDTNILVRKGLEAEIEEFKNTKVHAQQQDLDWMRELGIKPGDTFTCDELWAKVVDRARILVADKVIKEGTFAPGTNEKDADMLKQLFDKVESFADRKNAISELREGDIDGGTLLRAVDWVIAKSLWEEIWKRNRYADSQFMEGHSGYYASALGSGEMGEGDIQAETSTAIQAFQRTEIWEFKGQYVNAAMALPHFQGVGLFLLATGYPFFAMFVLLPGRAGAIFTWMGLWAWLKLWDLGFAVVMMIDNMLFALFPTSSPLEDGDIYKPGVAWQRVLEVDPNYSSMIYYNLIATCLFAVPVVTGLLAKKGGSEFISLVSDSGLDLSVRLGGSVASFARSLQTQTWFTQRFAAQDEFMRKEAVKWANNQSDRNKRLLAVAAAQGGSKAAEEFLKGSGGFGAIFKDKGAVRSALGALKDREKQIILADFDAKMGIALYEFGVSKRSSYAAERAVAQKWFTHSLQNEYPDKAIMNAIFAEKYLQQESIVQGGVNQAIKTATEFLGSGRGSKLLPPAGGSR